ncbi:MAG: hypothetical protein WDK96_01915 [Candidatus Paceibacterota bacterium]|jgi:hypothetical protein
MVKNKIELNNQNEKQPKNIIPGFISIFDNISLVKNETERKLLKEKFALAVKKVSEAWTIKDLYNATSLVIELSNTDDEVTMKQNLLSLWEALDGIDYKDNSEEANSAFLFIDHQVMMRYSTIISK